MQCLPVLGLVLLLAAAPATPDLSRLWVSAPPGGRGAIALPKPVAMHWVFKRQGPALHVDVKQLPPSRWYQSESLEGRVEGNLYTLAGTSIHPGPDDGPVRAPVRYELRWNEATGRFEGTRLEGKGLPLPFALAPVR